MECNTVETMQPSQTQIQTLTKNTHNFIGMVSQSVSIVPLDL